MNYISVFDMRIFRAVNGSFTSPFLDALMPYVTDKSNFLGVIIVAAALILVFGRRQDRVGLLLLVAVVATSDTACNGLKHLIGRVRPCHALDGVRLLVGCGGSYSMPSGHSTNIFAAMVFLSLRYRKFFPAFLTVAFLVAYSRVYVGVHYPGDILAGAMLGSLVAFVYFQAEKRLPGAYRAYRQGGGGAS